MFRNNRFHTGRVPHEGGFLVMVNMETDENVWMVKGENEEEVKGVVLIYVDDILFLSSPAIIQSL